MGCRVREVTPWWRLRATDAGTIGDKRREVSVLRLSGCVEWVRRCTIGLQVRILTSKSRIVSTESRMLSAKARVTTKGRLLTTESRMITTKIGILSVRRPK